MRRPLPPEHKPPWRAVAMLAMASLLSPGVHAASPSNDQNPPCADVYNTMRGPISPLDYRNQRQLLHNVESNHFTSQVENLVRAQNGGRASGGDLGGDIDYVLHLYPNHHRALVAMTRFGERTQTNKPPAAFYTVECYYTRALDFRPDDHIVRLLYADFLRKKNRRDDALAQLAVVMKGVPDDPLARYNAGLIYAGLGEYKLALEQAQFALRAGYYKTDLVDQLKKAGQWVELPEKAPDAASAPNRNP